MKMIIASLLVCIAAILSSPASADPSWVVLDVSTEKVLGQDKANSPHGPASLAKMMTVYLTFEALKKGKLRWNDAIVVSKNASQKIPLKLWLKPGSTITVREAVNGMIVRSANDAATAIAEHLGKTEARFAKQMTLRARQLGMKSTVFRNPWGMTQKGQSTTAYDMAVLAVALMRDFPQEYPLFAQPSFTFRGKTIKGHNNLMYRYAGVDGLKTGYTDASGFNLASSLRENNRRIVGVILGGKTARSRDNEMAGLLRKYSPLAAVSSNTLIARNNTGKESQAAPVVPAVPTPRSAQRQVKIARSPPSVASLIDESLIEQGDGGVMPLTNVAAWNIQIGAVDSRLAADRLLTRAGGVARSVSSGIGGFIEPFTKSGRTIYRVRFGGFDNVQAARNACAEFKRHSLDCIAVRM
ncbi:serine hydrolase [Phyllobacterium sp. K27]